MTENAAEEEELRRRWNTQLSVSPEFFDSCYIQAFNYIAAENAERKLYCFGCERIAFLTRQGKTIWTTSGDGEMEALPANVVVYIKQGKSKVVW